MRQAKKAAALKEAPIGCVIVHDEAIIARGYNRRTIDKKCPGPCGDHCHPQGMQKDRRLEAGGLHYVRHPGAVPHVRQGPSFRPGSPGGHRLHESKGRMRLGSVLDMLHEDGFNHQAEVETGVLGEECSPDDEGLLQGAARGRKTEKKRRKPKK